MEGRVDNLTGLHLGRSLDESPVSDKSESGSSFWLPATLSFCSRGRDEDHAKLRRAMELQLDKTIIDVHRRLDVRATDGLKST
jgi:hypothetical protein